MDLGIGGGEILVIIVVALILWGPGRMVEISRTIGKTIHNLNKSASQLTDQVTKEFEEEKRHLQSPAGSDRPVGKPDEH